ncbi:biotin synthase, partial [Vibrio parahaemolyticus]
RFGKEHRHELEQKFIDAGYYNTEWAKFYFPVKLLVLMLVSSIVLMSDMTTSKQLIIVILTLIGVIVVPDMLLEIRR